MGQDEIERNMGVQPLEGILGGLGLGNHDLVTASEEPITHKAVQRARKGRRLTKHMQQRVTAALNRAVSLQGRTVERAWEVSDLFTY
ncbi:MAG: hypothetical protein HS117_00560 [Verrucomicrobiaceae bacterium]|nr:hypothetical protein [Verrucomicrobiaceae bacterium]